MPAAREERRGRRDAALAVAEDVVYGGIAVLLVAAAAVLLVLAVDQLLEIGDELVADPVVEVLDTLLLVFIVVELLSAVRTTMAKRELVAEPFLLVGIIASIKEIVVVAGAERPKDAGFAEFRDGMVEIGVLSGVVLVLAIAALLLRMREEKPAEEDDTVGSTG